MVIPYYINISDRPPFLALPLELRQQIYGHVFHHCGDALSITNRQLYHEARPLVYKYAEPKFLDVESCIRFLHDIRHYTMHINSLSIIDMEASSQSCRLRDVFKTKGIEGLQTFKYSVKPSGHSTLGYTPIYLPSAEITSPAAVYDLCTRICRHPMTDLRKLRSLTVEGSPSSEIEEAIFNASRNIENLARREGKAVTRFENENALGWVYKIQIVD